jgi:hypothetical protein
LDGSKTTSHGARKSIHILEAFELQTVKGGHGTVVQPYRCGEELLEDVLESGRGQAVEDGAAAVIEHDHEEGKLVAPEGP